MTMPAIAGSTVFRLAPTRVMLLSNSGALAGGGELSLLDLVRGIDPHHVHPVVVCPDEGLLAERLRAAGVGVEVLPFPAWRSGRALAIARTLRRLASLVKSYAVELIHCNATWRLAIYATTVGRRLGIPVVLHVRVADSEPWKDRLLARLATRVIVNSDAVARRFRTAPPGRVVRIYNGIDVDRFAPGAAPAGLRASLELPPQVPVVGSVGRLVSFKGYDDLLEAAAIVRRADTTIHWVLVGDGELRAALERRCRELGLERLVRFTGWRDDVREYLALFELFVLPSRGEHFGRVLVEAMAMAKPVIATNAGGVPEIVADGQTGLLVPPAAPDALASAVLAMIRDPARAAQMGAAGRRRAISQFGLARHVEAVVELYRQTLPDRGEAR